MSIQQDIIFKNIDVNLYYGAFCAVKNLNLDIYKNEITALIGPSGCGKSTYIRTLNRMNDFIDTFRVEGTILLNNQNLYASDVNPVNIRLAVGMVFQKPNPFPKTIYQNIALGPKIAGFKTNIDDLVEDSLRQAYLWDEVKDKLHQNAYTLSGGQQQRLCIARAIAMQPDVLLLDEPTSALDPISTGKIESLLLSLKEKYSIVIVTHNMQQAARIGNYVGFFYQGELIEYDKTSIIFTNPSQKLTEEYITGRFG